MFAKDADVVMTFLDISRAHSHTETKRTLYTELPEDDPEDHKDKVGTLLRHLYGVRDASLNFDLRVKEVCVERGARKSLRYTCTFQSNSKATHLVSFFHHSDDFLIVGTRAGVKEMTEQIR